MSELQMAVKELRLLMERGEIKHLAKKHGVTLLRAYRLLKGQRKIADADNDFIMACYEKAMARKTRRNDKLKQLIK